MAGTIHDYLADISRSIQAAKAKFDAGEIDVNTYLKTVQPQLQEFRKQSMVLGGQGRDSANLAAQYLSDIEGISGLKQDMSKPGTLEFTTVGTDFGKKYQKQIRDSLLPQGLTEEQKAAYLNEIPEDIEFGTDQYNIEKEGLRQKLQGEKTAAEQKTKRQSLLTDLGSLLNQQVATQFDRHSPEIAEAANTGGLLHSSGFGEALAKYQTQLSEDAANTLANKAIEYGETDINAMGDILGNAQGFQTSGLNRKFSLDDYARQTKDAFSLAMATKPEAQGKSKGEKWAQGINMGLSAGNTAATAGKAK